MNLAHYREVVLPRILSRAVPERATVLHHAWYGDKWSIRFLFNGMPFRVTIEMLETPDDTDAEFTEEDARL